MTDTFGQGLACASLAQFGLQWIDRVEELLGEAEGSGDVEEDTDADPGIARLELPERRAGATRAVGSAIARNPVAYLIPCHRVIRKTGAFGGYHWGAKRKVAMLLRETAGQTVGDATHDTTNAAMATPNGARRQYAVAAG